MVAQIAALLQLMVVVVGAVLRQLERMAHQLWVALAATELHLAYLVRPLLMLAAGAALATIKQQLHPVVLEAVGHQLVETMLALPEQLILAVVVVRAGLAVDTLQVVRAVRVLSSLVTLERKEELAAQ
jgi:hypothetical protein